MIKKSFSDKWEVSIIKLKTNGKEYKVTKRMSEISVSETKMFKNKKEAYDQFRQWLMH